MKTPAFFSILFAFLGSGACVQAQSLPLAAGRAKFLGGIYSAAQSPNFASYFNQVTPENSGKWGSVEATRDVMNWTELDEAYAFAKAHGFPFKMHNLIWGSQQPAWIESLPADQQLLEIKQWFAAVAARYRDLDFIDVVNEPLRTPPNHTGNGGGNYIDALGGAGASGWDWVLTAFRLARADFPHARLLINEYSVTNSASSAQQYLHLVNLLQAENLIDGIGIQAHAFETTVPAATTAQNLDLIATAGLPIYVSELDIDGPTDQVQLDDYKRIFPVFWEHPAVAGVTLWGYRPGLWRDAEGAALVLADGTEKPAMVWLRSYLATNAPPVVAADQNFYISETAVAGAHVGTMQAGDADGFGTLRDWQIDGGTGADVFSLDAITGQLTLADASALNATTTPVYTVGIKVGDGRDTSATQTVTVHVYPASTPAPRLVNIATRAFSEPGNHVTIGGFVISDAEKSVLVRAVGPSLKTQGIDEADVLADPKIEIHRNDAGVDSVIASNDDWGDNANSAEIVSTASRVGAHPFDPDDTKSSALLRTLQPGIYSFVIQVQDGASGIVLPEIYDADTGVPPGTLVNIATRAYCTTGTGVTIGGFVIGGDIPMQVLLRAVGPTLATKGLQVSEVLADPSITLHQIIEKVDTVIASNDNWRESANAAAIVTTANRIGATPLAFSDLTSSAMLLTLQPGAYSFVARGKADTSGIVLVEVYDAD
jgi:endo-1,4-beta-xylanase